MNWKTLLVIIGAAMVLTRATRKKRFMLSKNFGLDEFVKSAKAKQLGIDNSPGPMEVANISALVNNVLQPLRDAVGYPIIITSGYRSPELNQAIGGALHSQHMQGQAADIKGKNNAQLFQYIKENLPFDQLIWEAGDNTNPAWVHVSYKAIGNRKQVLQYIPGQGYQDI